MKVMFCWWTIQHDFVIITAGQFWPEDAVTAVVIATDVRDETTANTLVQLLLSGDSESRLMGETSFQDFWDH